MLLSKIKTLVNKRNTKRFEIRVKNQDFGQFVLKISIFDNSLLGSAAFAEKSDLVNWPLWSLGGTYQ